MSESNDAVGDRISRLLHDLKQRRLLRTPAVEDAFRRVLRHLLVENLYKFNAAAGTIEKVELDPKFPKAEHLDIIYSDQPLITHLNHDNTPRSSSSMPGLVAQMLELLELEKGMKVLEIGTGTGYNAALMAHIVGDQGLVATVDIYEDVIAQTRRLLRAAGFPGIRLLARDGFYGVPKRGPYDRIIATVGCPDISPHWVEQLRESGVMLIPLTHAGLSTLVRIRKDGGSIEGKIAGITGFMSMRGQLEEHNSLPRAEDIARETDSAMQYPFASHMRLENTLEHNSFWYYLGVRDERTFMLMLPTVSSTYGLWAQASFIAIDPDKKCILLNDDSLYGILLDYYRDWSTIGRPSLHDYTLQFLLSRSERGAQPDTVGVVRRKFYDQFVRVSKQGREST